MKKSPTKLTRINSLHSSLSTDSEHSPKKPSDPAPYRRSVPLPSNELANARIIQSKLVYIINLPESVASEETLRRKEYFGQFGTILKCVVNKSSQHTAYQAYITYSSDEEAAVCIKACNKFSLDGNELSLTFGTTKYCNYFLRGNPCPKPDCLYLHQSAQQSNIISRESIPHTKHIQPLNSVIEGLKVIIIPPAGGYMLPSARIIKDRALSQQIFESPVRCFESKSRFGFAVEGEETELPGHIKTLRKLSAPKDEIAEIPINLYMVMVREVFSEKWLGDVLEFQMEPEKVLVFSRT